MHTTPSSHRLFSLFGGIALAALLVAPLQGQNDSIRRTLGKHTFLPSSLLGDPFAGTYVRNLTGRGLGGRAAGSEAQPRRRVPRDQDASIGFLTVGMEYQQALTNWLALRVGFTGGARLGTSGVALLSEGVTAQFGGTFGATAKLIRSDRFILSATADVLPGIAYQVSILDYVRDVVENGFENANSLVDESAPYRYRFGVNSAYTVAPLLGLQAPGTAAPWRDQTDSTATEIRFGAGASIDFDPIGPPIGVVLGYLYTDPVQGADVSGGAGLTNVGIFYTGHKRFVVGSVWIAVLTVALSLAVAIPAGYGLARLKLPWRGLILLAFLLPQAMPNLPIYVNIARVFYEVGLAGTVTGVVLVHASSRAHAGGLDRLGGIRGRRPGDGRGGAQPRRLAARHVPHDHAAARRARPDGKRDLRVPRIARRVHRHLFRRRAGGDHAAFAHVQRQHGRQLPDRLDHRAPASR